MTKTAQDIDIYAGETKQVTITVTDDAGAPKDLTGASGFWMALRDEGDDPGDAMAAKSGAQVTFVQVNGTGAVKDGFRFTLAPADTRSMEGSYYHEARTKDASGNEAVLCIGTLTVKPSPSKARL